LADRGAVRPAALGHGLLSFLFGVVIVGMTINVVARSHAEV
jgi:uncharacterized membrane protein